MLYEEGVELECRGAGCPDHHTLQAHPAHAIEGDTVRGYSSCEEWLSHCTGWNCGEIPCHILLDFFFLHSIYTSNFLSVSISVSLSCNAVYVRIPLHTSPCEALFNSSPWSPLIFILRFYSFHPLFRLSPLSFSLSSLNSFPISHAHSYFLYSSISFHSTQLQAFKVEMARALTAIQSRCTSPFGSFPSGQLKQAIEKLLPQTHTWSAIHSS